jgi:D-glucuronyl C5-epimerase C-terminus
VVGRLFGLLVAAAVAFPASATAAPVLVMGRGGHVTRHNDRFLNGLAVTLAPVPGAEPVARPAPPLRSAQTVAPPARTATIARAPAHAKRAPERTMVSELARLYRTGQINSAEYRNDTASWSAALATVKRLHGTRAAELESVVENLHAVAAAGELTPSRLPALFLTLNNNRQWWTTGPLPYSGQEIEFSGSQLVWEYYPGQGLELQVLATFGRADGMYTAGPSEYSQMQQLLSQMIPLAVQRAGGIAWEYYFRFDGGSPPWVSAMAQGTGIEALTRASEAFGPLAGPGSTGAQPGAGSQPGPGSQPSSPTYIQIAHRALGIFTLRPPVGVQVAARAGARYLQYSFAPKADIINAFLQSLIGLYDYAHASGDSEAQRLFAAGDAQARAELRSFDTGAWSLYQPGVEDTLSYHELVTGFLDELCTRTSAPVYCTTAQHFHAYMTTAPALQLVTTQTSAKATASLRFQLSKYSRVGIVVMRGQSTVFSTSAYFGYGVNDFQLPRLPAGTYTVRLAATDLPGNFNRITGTLRVSKAPHSP